MNKYHFMIFGEKKDNVGMKLHVGMAAVTLDTKLNFKTHTRRNSLAEAEYSV